MGLFKTKEQEPIKKRKGHVFTDAERMLAKSRRDEKKDFASRIKRKQEEILILDLELKKREKIKQIRDVDDPLGEMSYDDNDYDEEEEETPTDLNNPDALMTGLLTKALLSHQNKQKESVQSPQPPISSKEVVYSDDDIQKMVNLLPNDLIQKSKLVNDNTLSSIISEKAPQLTKENVAYAVKLIRAK